MYFCTMNGAYRSTDPGAQDPFPNMVVAVNISYDHYTGQRRGDAFICYARPELAAYCLERLGDGPQLFRGRYVHIGRTTTAMRMHGNKSGAQGHTRVGTQVWNCN